MITKGQERCLYCVHDAEFQRIAAAAARATVTHTRRRAYGGFFASAHDEVPDKQGRVTIPAHLREVRGIES